MKSLLLLTEYVTFVTLTYKSDYYQVLPLTRYTIAKASTCLQLPLILKKHKKK